MTTYSVAQAKNRLSELIDRALKGEDVVITRHGHAVAQLRTAPQPGRKMTAEDVDWIRRAQIIPRRLDDDRMSIVERMRNEDHERLLRR